MPAVNRTESSQTIRFDAVFVVIASFTKLERRGWYNSMHDSTTVQNNIIYDNKMRFLNHIAELLILCTIALTTVTGLKPTTFHNQTLLAKSTQEGTTSMTTTSSQELKHHNQTSLKSKYDGGPSWLLNVPLGWGSHHAAHSIQRHNDSSTNDSNFGQAYLQRFDEFVELAFDDGEAVDIEDLTTPMPHTLIHPLTTHTRPLIHPLMHHRIRPVSLIFSY